MAKLINEGDFVHIWWMCPDIREYWDAIWSQVSQIVGYLLPNDPLVILLGLLNGNVRAGQQMLTQGCSGPQARLSCNGRLWPP
uniref:Uncharacterized protein n=1 Tax=Chelonoidis abingdonii TaxID=106734 RepID=A0A8C0GZU6_CHEAB